MTVAQLRQYAVVIPYKTSKFKARRIIRRSKRRNIYYLKQLYIRKIVVKSKPIIISKSFL